MRYIQICSVRKVSSFFNVKAGDTCIVHSRLKVKSVSDLRGNVIYCLTICCWRVLQNLFVVTNQENSRFDLPWGKITKNASLQGIRCTFACFIGKILDPEKPRIPRTINVLWNLFFPVLNFGLETFCGWTILPQIGNWSWSSAESVQNVLLA
jgi:hypothetical protein